ncbi:MULTISPECIES: type II secretion system protein GspM [Gammaproteobacteria]|uniref:type II secretion system protein GspM n=1 Tax=Gammaproteobacteria TaxID=1236 RepID=UPI000DD00321|nr:MULTISPECIES: type II secretion system protein GspM [Gammaproteobacteria]RTE86393.1 hypothetical protein DQX04_07475 [Aliidiomarina sp. B3213]TCZ91740.1 hypothetical protein EYQ95_07480 [Lysobacter sp. N42]
MRIWARLKDGFDSRSIREQWILGVLLIGIIGWIGFLVMIEPALEKRAQVKTELDNVRTTTTALEAGIPELTARANVDLNRSAEQRIEQLQRQNARLTQSLEAQAEFVQPSELLTWIQSLLISTESLELTYFDAKPAAPLTTTQDSEQATEQAAMEVYRHPVEVVLEGDFEGIHNYLTNLNELPLSFYWKSLDYQVIQYPQARVTLNLYTLSYGTVAAESDEGGENAQ